MTDSDKPVTEKACDSRHRPWRTFAAIISTALLAVIGLLGSDIYVGYHAEASAGKVASELNTHVKVQAEHDKHIDETLDRIESQIETSQTTILEAIAGGE